MFSCGGFIFVLGVVFGFGFVSVWFGLVFLFVCFVLLCFILFFFKKLLN